MATSGDGFESLDTPAPDKLESQLTLCDREPIHIPGAIQPHGILLVADSGSFIVLAGAGELETRLTPDWLGRSLTELLDQDVIALVESLLAVPGSIMTGQPVRGLRETFDVSVSCTGTLLLVELEPAPALATSASAALVAIDSAGAAFERATDMPALCRQAAAVFRDITGFDRVMIYRFLEDGAGAVVAEDKAENLPSFLNHHFPASDIPRQARALYIRNRVRVIADIDYTPQPLRPAVPEIIDLDMSDVALRSVSPVHIRYMQNMGLAASASMSIVQDGELWGLVACHHRVPRALTYDIRAACRTLAGSLARQIKAKEQAEDYREAMRLTNAASLIMSGPNRDEELIDLLERSKLELQQMFGATGFAAVYGSQVIKCGHCPEVLDLLALSEWASPRAELAPYRTSTLPQDYAPAAAFPEVACGLLATRLEGEQPAILLWFRAEKIEIINWAGNPHKGSTQDPAAILNPRSSFDAWSETVRGGAEPWSRAETEAAHRIRASFSDIRQTRRLKLLNQELSSTILDRERLLRQKDFLMREVNHRVQNSLQLVSSYLHMQAAMTTEQVVRDHIEEASRRLAAVSLVHRRLYRNDQVDSIDLSLYLAELHRDLMTSHGEEWDVDIKTEWSSAIIDPDRATYVGLIMTELVINATKYAYAGGPGPLLVKLERLRNRFRLTVADQGAGTSAGSGEGFGSVMMKAMVERLQGSIELLDNKPGLRVVVTAPLDIAS